MADLIDYYSTEFRGWLENRLEDIVRCKIRSIALCVVDEHGDVLTANYGMTVNDKRLCAGALHDESIIEMLKNNEGEEYE